MAKKSTLNGCGPAGDDDWRAQDDLRTLTRAQEISADRARLKAAQGEAKKQQTALARVAGSNDRRPQSRPAARSNLSKRRI